MLGQVQRSQSLTIRGLAHEFDVLITPSRKATRHLVSEGALQVSNSDRISLPNLK